MLLLLSMRHTLRRGISSSKKRKDEGVTALTGTNFSLSVGRDGWRIRELASVTCTYRRHVSADRAQISRR